MESAYANLERIAGCPIKYSPSLFFGTYITAFLPPIYRMIAVSLAKGAHPSFRKMWAWESECLLRECGLEEKLGDTQRYATQLRDESLPGFSFRLSEVYRSAFMRTLAWFHFAGHLDESKFKEISLMASPVDLSLWDVTAQPPPKWWPHLPEKSLGPSEPAANPLEASWHEIRDLIRLEIAPFGQSVGRILAAEGANLPEDIRSSKGTHISFNLLGFAYKVMGPNVPDADEVANRIIFYPRYRPQIGSLHCTAVLDAAADDLLTTSDYAWVKADSLEIAALISRFESFSIHTWQWYRARAHPFALSPLLMGPGLTVRRGESSWNYLTTAGEVARIYDWRIGALERDPKNSFPTHGQVAEIDFGWLSERLAEKNLRLGYLLQLELKVQSTTYGEAKEFKHTELLDVSRIV